MRRSALLSLLVVTAVAGSTATAAPRRDAARAPGLQRALDDVVAAGVPGAVLLVRRGGATVRLASGYADVKTRAPMGDGDRFRVGSITKSFVATVVPWATSVTSAPENPAVLSK